MILLFCMNLVLFVLMWMWCIGFFFVCVYFPVCTCLFNKVLLFMNFPSTIDYNSLLMFYCIWKWKKKNQQNNAGFHHFCIICFFFCLHSRNNFIWWTENRFGSSFDIFYTIIIWNEWRWTQKVTRSNSALKAVFSGKIILFMSESIL